jgi:hypothetical protein
MEVIADQGIGKVREKQLELVMSPRETCISS